MSIVIRFQNVFVVCVEKKRSGGYGVFENFSTKFDKRLASQFTSKILTVYVFARLSLFDRV